MLEHTMPQLESLVTTVSTKGQVILPKAVRQRRDWNAGTRLIVEETEDGILLRQPPPSCPPGRRRCSPVCPTRAIRSPSRRWMPRSLSKPGDTMIAIDTNVVVRYLTGDHPEQSCALARWSTADLSSYRSWSCWRQNGCCAAPMATR